MVGGRVEIVATAGGFLVRTPTGRAVVAPDLGAVWKAMPDRDGATRLRRLPAGLLGLATLPAPRSALTRVVLVSEAQPPPAVSDIDLDACGLDSDGLVAQLLALTSDSRPRLICARVSG
ncbi:MAG: hypothetical protein H0T91_08855, partial [Propionibacteriaceae bacterium]|nr:hypothetical protein [Propionibacteriaceae bacterium]